MTRARRLRGLATLGLAVLLLGPSNACGPAAPPAHAAVPPLDQTEVHVEPNRPPLGLLAREGDPSPTLAIAISTEGLDVAHAPEVALALGTLFEERLRTAWPTVEARTGWEQTNLRGALAEDSLETTFLAVDRALKTPVAETELPALRKRLASLAKRPLPDAALRDLARCRGEPFASAARGSGPGTSYDPPLAEVERWRAGAVTLGRIAMAVVGPTSATRKATNAVAAMTPFAAAAPIATAAEAVRPPPFAFVEAPGLAAPRVVRAHVIARSPEGARAVMSAASLGAAESTLLARMAAVEGAPKVEEIVGTAGLGGGCVAISLDFGALDVASPTATSRIATSVALAEKEVAEELTTTQVDPAIGRTIARRAVDPRDAAERSAWWTLLATQPQAPLVPREETAPHVAVVVAPAKDKATPPDAPKALAQAIDRARQAFERPAIVAKTRLERGQGELWMLVASPCGTVAEVANDAGLAAAFVLATTTDASSATNATTEVRVSGRRSEGLTDTEGGIVLEPWITPEAIGLIAHGPPRARETPAAHAERIADAVARTFIADPLDERAAARARSAARMYTNDPRLRAMFVLGEAIAPDHPSWLAPLGNPESLARAPAASLLARGAALREGPLRVAVLANAEEEQGAIAARAIDRWIPRRPEGTRACPVPNTGSPTRAGTYAVEVAGLSEAYVAFPLADAPQIDAAEWLVDILEGEGGLLTTAMAGFGTGTARVAGARSATTLLVHVASRDAVLDGAIAQLRGLFDKLRKGAIAEADVTRATARRTKQRAQTALDPRRRLATVFADSPNKPVPTAQALAAVAPAILREESMVVVALRPPRVKAP